MAKTYAELTQQISQLQAQAEARRLSEAKGVIRTINEAIATYGLTAADLKFAQAVPAPTAAPKAQSAVVLKSVDSSVVKSGGKGYSDGAGNNWTGRGPRPKWLREALAAGDSISKFEVTGSSKAPAPAKAKLPVKFRDAQTGEDWSGRGMKPKWLRRAINSGRDLAEFDVSKGNSVSAASPLATAPSAAAAVKVAAKSIPAKKAATASASAKKAVPAKKLAASVPAEKAATAVKAPSKKAAIASTSAKKFASVSVKAAKAERAPAKAASALQASTAQAHVPVVAVTILDADVGTVTSATAAAASEVIPVQQQ